MKKYLIFLFLNIFCSSKIYNMCDTGEINKSDVIRITQDKLSQIGMALSGEISVKKFEGGASSTTLNFLVSDDQNKYVLRSFKPNHSDPATEIANFVIASNEGYGPHIYFAGPSQEDSQKIIIMEYLEWKSATHEQLKSDEFLKHVYVMLANLLKKIHTGPDFQKSESNYFEYLEKNYLQHNNSIAAFKNLNPNIYEKIEKIINDLRQVLLVPNLLFRPCHNDINPGNLIYLGNEFKVIDFGSAAQYDPYFDIAKAAVTVMIRLEKYYKPDLEAELEKVLLETYLDRQPTEIEKARFYLNKQLIFIEFGISDISHISPEIIEQYSDRIAAAKFNYVLANCESQKFSDAIRLLGN
ncbi:MAG: phosphotransferase [Candidatus Babeliales bacterium]